MFVRLGWLCLLGDFVEGIKGAFFDLLDYLLKSFVKEYNVAVTKNHNFFVRTFFAFDPFLIIIILLLHIKGCFFLILWSIIVVFC
jgi:hypothetical protein